MLPGYYGTRPRHIHWRFQNLNSTGHTLVTQNYFELDPVSDDPRWLQRRLPIQAGSNYSFMIFDVVLVRPH